MNNIPLHPMIVHFPIVLAILLPVFALAALTIIRRRRNVGLWIVPFALAVLLAGSAFVAMRTGEAEEERVENVVPENVLHQHEEAAERFLVVAGLIAGIAALGLVRGTIGSAARIVATVGSLVIVFLGVQVGQAGGALVYEHNAGAAYVSSGGGDGQGKTNRQGADNENDSDAR